MEIQKLKDICLTEITDGTHQTPTYSEYGYIFLSSKNVTTQKIDWDNVMFIPEKLHEELYKRVAPQIDDILLAKNGTTGVAAIVDRDIVFDIYVSLALIRPNTEIVMPRYLLYAINNPVVKGYFDSSLKGIGVPNLHLKNIRETPIKIYDLETQKVIVEKLDKVCELISLRKQQLEKLDELVKTRFVEMFENVTEENALENLCHFIDYRGKTPEKSDSGLPFITAKNIRMHYMSFDTQEFISKENYDKVMTRGIPKVGDVVFTTEAPLGNVCRIPQFDTDFYIGQRIITMQTKLLNPVYLEYALSSDDFKRKLVGKSSGSTVTGIRSKLLGKLTIPVPSKGLQNQFAAFVERVDKQKQTVQQSLEKLELMKKALMQEYFG